MSLNNSIARNIVINLKSNKELTMTFNKPIKDNKDIYQALFQNNVSVKLPELKICSTGTNDNGEHEIWYNIDLDNTECQELIKFLYNLDELAFSTSRKKSKEWFGKSITPDVLENLYEPCYADEDGNIVLKAKINKSRKNN
jgi:hypothetical protein